MDKLKTAQLEMLRRKMVETANQEQSLLHREVLHLSEMLDQMIINVQREKCAKRKSGLKQHYAREPEEAAVR
ncbi:aspartyl-phosphate phosphatase Spo0E family protein [Paenibacillus sp. GCM10012307]|uniref:Aspartyl-phosphate phosphatase Spo0E family protein n=1 Tax=Paenibacillus roseus TaxID=2798579 RepID=A0A934MML0_9BACL|nr:aspartyl-phosphate phosphatase Spo0E family protein [Paenibacillus roseus]MBJ6363460.1 aspartyl-phosphate phosphatase Spo0E family protein [Paenibacillus roseus]